MWLLLQLKKESIKNFLGGLVVKILSSNARGMDLIPDRRTKVPRATGRGQNLKKKKIEKNFPMSASSPGFR